jgi:hypothetical protein
MTGQHSLNNFYQSIKHHNPSLAMLMGQNLLLVSLYALSADKTEGQTAAECLRQQAIEFNLPEVHRRVLNSALTELGYS